MRMPTFNKKEETATCLFCKTNPVPMKDWNKRCPTCKETQVKKDKDEARVNIQSRQPAAVITIENGQKVFVDKFGNEVPNPGYDLQNDPRGYKHTGTKTPGNTTYIK